MERKDKEKQMLKYEIENCKQNIDFYKQQIDNMRDRISELEELRKAYEYY